MHTEKVTILAIGAHPDDVELACSGTLLKHISLGHKVAIVDLTEGELGSRGTVQTRYDEAAQSAKILGVSSRENLCLKDGFFRDDKESLLSVIRVIRYYQPDIILVNAPSDRHPDHGRAAKLVSDAAFYSGLRKIETIHEGIEQKEYRPKQLYHFIQDRYLKPDFVVDVSAFIDRKFEAIMAFKTQFFDPDSVEPVTPISSEHFLDFIRARMIEFGRPANFDFAEGFIASRTIGIASLSDIL